MSMRTQQLSQRDEYMDKVAISSFESRKHAAIAYTQKNACWMMKGDYEPGEMVLVSDERHHFQHDLKGQPHWFGPYIIIKHHESGAFILQELDRTILKRPVAWKWIKSYHFRRNLKPIIQ